ncbi:MAG: mechanosensitive ion channel family protein [Bacilli bacterium]
MGFWESVGQWFVDLWESLILFLTTGETSSATNASSFLGKLVIALIIFVVFYYVNKLIILILKKKVASSKTSQNAKTARLFGISILNAVLAIILVVVVFGILGFSLTGLSTIISAAVVAIGLSLQNVISNFASGLILITTHNFVVGDYISVGSSIEGTVKEVRLLHTQLITFNNIAVYVPNSTLTSQDVTNYNTMEYRRINLVVNVSYDCDPKEVKRVLKYVVGKQAGINKEMPISVVLDKLDASSVNFAVRCYVPTAIYWDTLFQLREDVFVELKKRNIEIPYGKLDVNLNSNVPPKKRVISKDIKDEDIYFGEGKVSPVVQRQDSRDLLKFLELAKKQEKKTKKETKKKSKK